VIVIDVELLTGRYIASTFNDRDVAEWPPHPARLFSALVAAAIECQEISTGSRRALEWLEEQGPPHILASRAERRAVVTTYVPENPSSILGDWSSANEKLEAATEALKTANSDGNAKDILRARGVVEKAEKKLAEQLAKSIGGDERPSPAASSEARALLPSHRGKQPRTSPSVTPEQPHVLYVWPQATADSDTLAALSELTQRMVRLGHSSSLVACRVAAANALESAAPGLESWVPDDSGTEKLRTVTDGQLSRLESAFERHQGVTPRVLPAHHQAYARASGAKGSKPANSVFGEWIVFREVALEGERRVGLRLTRAEDVARALRGALLHHVDDPAPGVLTGHTPGGGALARPHVAFVALADVGSRYASGAMLGMAVVLPRAIDSVDRRAILRGVGNWERSGLRLTLGRVGAVNLERVADGDPRSTLDPATWGRPSRRWASVTPVALDENPGDLASRDPVVAAEAAGRAEEIVARSCERIGLPRPAWVQVMRRSVFDAAPPAKRFMPFPRAPRSHHSAFRRVCVHVELRFHEIVAGPVLLGAGRYYGIGLCRPQRDED
jgi:CRISPR-associated protein Csb2